MKNSKKIIWLLTVLFITINLNNCSDSEVQFKEESSAQRKSNDSTNLAQRAFTCHSFIIGSSLLGLSTTVYYCCAGDTLCGGPTELGCVCGFVSETTYNDITSLKIGDQFTNKIHVSEFEKEYSQKSLNISYSSSMLVDGLDYSVKCKDYEVDKNGYITLELVKK